MPSLTCAPLARCTSLPGLHPIPCVPHVAVGPLDRHSPSAGARSERYAPPGRLAQVHAHRHPSLNAARGVVWGVCARAYRIRLRCLVSIDSEAANPLAALPQPCCARGTTHSRASEDEGMACRHRNPLTQSREQRHTEVAYLLACTRCGVGGCSWSEPRSPQARPGPFQL